METTRTTSGANDANVVAFEVLGVGAAVEAGSSALAERIRAGIPRGAVERGRQPDDAEFTVDAGAGEPDRAVDDLWRRLREHLALNAPGHVLVRAQAVAIGGRAIVLAGPPDSAEPTLLGALVRAGADRFADGYVAIDSNGLIYPYVSRDAPVDHSGHAGLDPAYVGVLAAVERREGAALALRESPRERGAELLLENTCAAEQRTDLAQGLAKAATQHAVVVEGECDGADGTAAALLARLAGGAREKQNEPPPAIRFVTLVFELEARLVELAEELEKAGIEAVLLNADGIGTAFAKGFADAVPAIVEVPRAQVPRALGVMEAGGWSQTPGERRPRYHRKGVVVQVRPRPDRGRLARVIGRDPGPVATGRYGFAEPRAEGPAAGPTESRRPEPLDPGGPLRTGRLGAAALLASEGLTVLDTITSRTREREFRGMAIQYGPGAFGFESVTERHLRAILERIPGDGTGSRVVEVGTGTGAVALSVARERPRAEVLATDVSLRALGWARRNRRRLGVPQVRLAQGSLLAPVPDEWRGSVTLIAANPPLAPPGRGVELSGTSGWPAGTATGPGADGLGLVRAIAHAAREVLAPGGNLQFQLQGPQAPLIAPYLDDLGYEHDIPAEGPRLGTAEVGARWPGRPEEMEHGP